MNQHPIQGGVEILQVASCYRNRYKLRPGGLRLARMHTLPLPTARSDLFSGPHQRIGNSHLKLKNGGVDRTFQGLKTWLRHFLKGIHHDPQIHSRSFCSTFVPLMVLSWINVTGDNVLFQNWYLLVVETVQGTPTKQDLILFKISDQHPHPPFCIYGTSPGRTHHQLLDHICFRKADQTAWVRGTRHASYSEVSRTSKTKRQKSTLRYCLRDAVVNVIACPKIMRALIRLHVYSSRTQF